MSVPLTKKPYLCSCIVNVSYRHHYIKGTTQTVQCYKERKYKINHDESLNNSRFILRTYDSENVNYIQSSKYGTRQYVRRIYIFLLSALWYTYAFFNFLFFFDYNWAHIERQHRLKYVPFCLLTLAVFRIKRKSTVNSEFGRWLRPFWLKKQN